MRIESTTLDGVLFIHLDRASDERGSFTRLFAADMFRDVGIDFAVVQAGLSRNTARHTLRGLHHQRDPHAEGKIVRCSRGRVFDVAVDLRPAAGSYLSWLAFELDGDRDEAIFLPPGIAHGFLTLEPDCEVAYLMDAPYVADAADGIRYDDPRLAIDWPAPPAAISERDRRLPLLGDA